MLVSKKPNASPNASRWNIVHVGHFHVGIALGMSISSCLRSLSLRWVVNANDVSGGIQALILTVYLNKNFILALGTH